MHDTLAQSFAGGLFWPSVADLTNKELFLVAEIIVNCTSFKNTLQRRIVEVSKASG